MWTHGRHNLLDLLVFLMAFGGIYSDVSALKDCQIYNRKIRIHSTHTACLTTTPCHSTMCYNINTSENKESLSTIQKIANETKLLILKKLSEHQLNQPVPTQYLTWDLELADMAQKWSTQCQTKGDHPENRAIPHTDGIWSKTCAVDQIILANVSSVDDFLSHQEVIAKVQKSSYSKVGCGWTRCHNLRNVFVCNFIQSSRSLRKQRDTSGSSESNGGMGRRRFRNIQNRLQRNRNRRMSQVQCTAQRFECSIVHDRPDLYNWRMLCLRQPDFVKGCPFMCGRCNTCRGFYCKNHGMLLDTSRCICRCKTGYRGADCSICEEDRPYTFDSERCSNED